MAVSVTADEVGGAWRPLTTEEATGIETKSARAWTRLAAVVPALEKNLEADLVREETVKDVMVSMIVRVLKNPESVRTVAESIDDGSESRTLDNSISTGELYVTDFEIAMLTPQSELPSYGLYTIGLGGR